MSGSIGNDVHACRGGRTGNPHTQTGSTDRKDGFGDKFRVKVYVFITLVRSFFLLLVCFVDNAAADGIGSIGRAADDGGRTTDADGRGKAGSGYHVGADFIFVLIQILNHFAGNFVFVFPEFCTTLIKRGNGIGHFPVTGFKLLIGICARRLPFSAQIFAFVFQFGKALIDAIGELFDIMLIFLQPAFRAHGSGGTVTDHAVHGNGYLTNGGTTEIGNFLFDFLAAFIQFFLDGFFYFGFVAGIFFLHILIDFYAFAGQKALQNGQIDFFVQGLLINVFALFIVGRFHKFFGRRRFRTGRAAQFVFGFQLGGGNHLRNHLIASRTLGNTGYLLAVFLRRFIELNFVQFCPHFGKGLIFLIQRIGFFIQFFNGFGCSGQTKILTDILFYFDIYILKQRGKLFCIFLTAA